MKVLKAVAGNDKVKVVIIKSGGSQLILEAISKHLKATSICEVGCSVIATLVLRNPGHCKIMIESGAAEILVKIMIMHPSQAAVQVNFIMINNYALPAIL